METIGVKSIVSTYEPLGFHGNQSRRKRISLCLPCATDGSGGSRITLGGRGVLTPNVGRQTYYFRHFFLKLNEIEKKN